MLGLVQDAARLGQEGPAGRGESHRAVGPVEQLDAQVGLEQLDLSAQRRLCHVQAFRGTGEMQFFCDGHEARQLGQREH